MNNIIHTIRHTARAAAVLLLALCAAQTAGAWSGQGTETEPYKITNASDLQQLADYVNKGTTYESVYVVAPVWPFLMLPKSGCVRPLMVKPPPL